MSIIKSLRSRNSTLASTEKQLEILNCDSFKNGKWQTFREKLIQQNEFPLKPTNIEIFQVNIGYMCNQTCKHCHVDAGPDRKEIMTQETMQQCLDVIAKYNFHTLDITGGAPEMNPNFRWFVSEAKKIGVKEIIVRCNLTIILANQKYNDLPEFFKEHQIRVVSSLPFYNADRTDRQRGTGVFEKSIKALQMLNAVGYGKENSGLILDLVYNPNGAFLPADQKLLEIDFKNELRSHFGIEFNNLLAITNIPISRYLEYLIDSDNFEEYMDLLVRSYNPATVKNVMCRNTISVGWNGNLYDCDFNQMLDLNIDRNAGQHISVFDLEKINNRNIVINQHCFGCTAGSGSSCQGTTI
jgi:radical SAM/Cys-rich protein